MPYCFQNCKGRQAGLGQGYAFFLLLPHVGLNVLTEIHHLPVHVKVHEKYPCLAKAFSMQFADDAGWSP